MASNNQQAIAPNFKATVAATQLKAFKIPFSHFTSIHVDILKKNKGFKEAFDSVEQNKEKIYSENLATLNKILDEVIDEHLKSNNGQFSDAKIYEELRKRLTPHIQSIADSEDDLKIEEIRSKLEKLTLSELRRINNDDQRPRSEEDLLSEEAESSSIDDDSTFNETENTNISPNNQNQTPRLENDQPSSSSLSSMQIENGETHNLANLKPVISMRRGASLKKDIVSTVIEEKKDEFKFVKDKVRKRDFELFTLSGQIAAIDEEKKTILQTRSRQNDPKLQSTDTFQILAILCISQCHKCLFAVQSGDGKITYETIEFDDQYFIEISKHINSFVNKARTLTLDDISKIATQSKKKS